jgi:hypothetical protein
MGEPKPVWCGAMVSIVGDEDKMEVSPVVNKAGKTVTSCVSTGRGSRSGDLAGSFPSPGLVFVRRTQGKARLPSISAFRMNGNAGRISLDVVKLVLEELRLGDNGLHELFCILTACKSWKVHLLLIYRHLLTHYTGRMLHCRFYIAILSLRQLLMLNCSLMACSGNCLGA